MMNFTLKSVKPAKEDLEMRPGEVDGTAWKDPVSAGAHLLVCGEILSGICKSLARALVARGLPKEDVNAKMTELVNLFVKNGDASKGSMEWIVEHDFTNFDWDVTTELEKVSRDNRYDVWWTIFDAARSGVSCGSQWSDECQNKMNDREKELVKTLKEASEAYYNAKCAYQSYVTDHAVLTINDMFMKYGETLSKIDKTWYDQVEVQLKAWVERTLARMKEKKAEDDASADRATPAE